MGWSSIPTEYQRIASLITPRLEKAPIEKIIKNVMDIDN